MISIKKITFFKTIAFIKLTKEIKSPKKILVVGSGNGTEVACLGEHFPDSTVNGIDMVTEKMEDKNWAIEPGDAENMRFSNNQFDLLYSYHVLEHVSNPAKVISEMHRVLQENGELLLGTPNRSRLIGYMSGDATLWRKIKWNFKDWKAMIRGRFKNELGEHAGFTYKEMEALLSKEFAEVHNVTREYYEEIYKNKKEMVSMIYKLGMHNRLLPAVYFVAKKTSHNKG